MDYFLTPDPAYESIKIDGEELLKLLTASIKTAKSN
jgi:hypothetical protein